MSSEPKVYIARAGRNGEDEETALDNDMAIVGFREVPDLGEAGNYQAVVKLVKHAFPDQKPRAQTNFAGQLFTFAHAMQEGDIIVLPRKLTSQIALGLVTGSYSYRNVNSKPRHTRPVNWKLTDVPRTHFQQDLLYSFGAFLTVCNISRNDAARRIQSVLSGKPDPGPESATLKPTSSDLKDDSREPLPDLLEVANDQIVAHIQARFVGHSLTRLVDSVLQADGWVTKVSPPGPDGGVDILAGSGPLGLDAPRLCVQVKSQNSPADVTVYRTLQGTMQTFGAQQGLLVCWGGYNNVVLKESKQAHFTVRLWDSRDLVKAIYRHYDRLPAEIQADLPLQRVWMLVAEDSEA